MCLICVMVWWKMQKRVQVTFTESQWNILEYFRGELGDSDADIVRNIVLAWLSEKSFITSTIKYKQGGYYEM